MQISIPSSGYKMRLIALGWGILIFLWSSIEDNNVSGVTVLGWITSLIVVSFGLMSRFGGICISGKKSLMAGAGIGAIIGASASLSIAILMLFKDVRHAHIFPDYPPQMIVAILERLPIWTIGTACIALGLTLMIQLMRANKI